MDSSRVYLRRVSDKSLVEAVLLDDLDAAHLQQMEATWLPIIERVKQTLPRDQWPEDWHWNWRDKISASHIFGKRAFSVVCDSELQGATLVDLANISPHGARPVLYVDYLATAPWNRKSVQDPPRYRGVGTILMAAATQLSIDEGLKGRVGLHSLPDADHFYEKVLGMTPLGRDPQKQQLMYFEFTSEQAAAFLAQPPVK